MKRAIVTMATGPKYSRLYDLTSPYMRRYASKVGAEFCVIDERKFPVPHYDKLQLRGYLGCYDRVIFLDIDTLVADTCPDLFGIVPDDHVGGSNEAPHVPNWEPRSAHFAGLLGVPVPEWRGVYINTGVMVLSAGHAPLFDDPGVYINDGVWEQTYLNVRLQQLGYPVCCIPKSFNQTQFNNPPDNYRDTAHIIHYAGMGNDRRMRAVDYDVQYWRDVGKLSRQ